MAITLPPMPGGWNDLRSFFEFMKDKDGRKTWFEKTEALLAEINAQLELTDKVDQIERNLARAVHDRKMAAALEQKAQEKAAEIVDKANGKAKAIMDDMDERNKKSAEIEKALAARAKTLNDLESSLAAREKKAESTLARSEQTKAEAADLLKEAERRNNEADKKIKRIAAAISG